MTDINNIRKLQNANTNVDKHWQQLNLSIHSTPDDLILHTQRILFCLDNDLSEEACASLQDLFITLNGEGKDLHRRMFNLVSPIIETQERSSFQKYLDGNCNVQLLNDLYSKSMFQNKELKL